MSHEEKKHLIEGIIWRTENQLTIVMECGGVVSIDQHEERPEEWETMFLNHRIQKGMTFENFYDLLVEEKHHCEVGSKPTEEDVTNLILWITQDSGIHNIDDVKITEVDYEGYQAFVQRVINTRYYAFGEMIEIIDDIHCKDAGYTIFHVNHAVGSYIQYTLGDDPKDLIEAAGYADSCEITIEDYLAIEKFIRENENK